MSRSFWSLSTILFNQSMEWFKIKMQLDIWRRLLCSFSLLAFGNFPTSNCCSTRASRFSRLCRRVFLQDKSIPSWSIGHLISFGIQAQLSHCCFGSSSTCSYWFFRLLIILWRALSSWNNRKLRESTYHLTQKTWRRNRENGPRESIMTTRKGLGWALRTFQTQSTSLQQVQANQPRTTP